MAALATGVLLVLVGGYLLIRALVPGPNLAIEREERAYETWVSGFAAGLGGRPALVILEPDALAQLHSCLDAAQQQARLLMLSYAVRTLQTKSDRVYLDAGHSNWIPAGVMAARLRAADIAQAYGFSLNVSNFDTTEQEVGYAAELNRDLGMTKRFVIDTSRNGGSGAGTPPGASRSALANRLYTDPNALAALWVRAHPGDPLAQQIAQRIASQPTARWFGTWSGDIAAAVSSYTAAASGRHKVPILVAYDIPHLNCGSGNTSGAQQWCNPPGRQLGSAPRVLDSRGDLGLWIKAPGESDGNCGAGAGTQAGQFSPALARELITGRP